MGTEQVCDAVAPLILRGPMRRPQRGHELDRSTNNKHLLTPTIHYKLSQSGARQHIQTILIPIHPMIVKGTSDCFFFPDSSTPLEKKIIIP